MFDTTYLERCISSLKHFYTDFKAAKPEDKDYNIRCNTLLDTFEITIEEIECALRKLFSKYFCKKQNLDTLTLKECIEKAYCSGLLEERKSNNWICYQNIYRAKINHHKDIHKIISQHMEDFIEDVEALINILEHYGNNFIDEKDYNRLQSIFLSMCPNAVIWAYGSRTKPSEAHKRSNLDLALIRLGDNALDMQYLLNTLNETSLSVHVDLKSFDTLSYDDRTKVEQHHILFYPQL